MTLPPGPPLPATLQALIWARRPLSFLEVCRRRYGDVFTLRIQNGGTWVVLANPQDVRRIFTTDHEQLGVGLANSVLGPLLGPGSVMLLEEPDHIRRRRVMLPAFHGARMAGYRQMIEQVILQEIREWPEGPRSHSGRACSSSRSSRSCTSSSGIPRARAWPT